MDYYEKRDLKGKGISLLSLDGGGVRGLSSLLILQRIMECADSSYHARPCDYFDMICGTSTGGLIAIMLGRLQMTVSECIEEYQKLSMSVFTKRRHRVNWRGKIQGRFDHQALEEGIKDLLRRRGLSEDELLKDPGGNPHCKTFVCSILQQTSDIVVFPNYYSKTWGSQMLDRVRIWEAARATSAATSFFEPLTIDGKDFADGATGANNPIYELWAEASSVFGDDNTWRLEDHLKCLVSIGTGIPALKPFGPGIADVASALKAIATASESKAQQFQRQHPFLVRNSIFYRLNVNHGLEDVALEEADRLGDIESSTYSYCASAPVLQQITSCARTLRRRSSTSSHSALGISEAISKFNNHFEDRILTNLYETQSNSLTATELQRYIHTKPFQEWITGDRSTIVCTTTRTVSDTPCALGACIAEHILKQADYTLLYVDCYWVLQTPQRVKEKSIARRLLKLEFTPESIDGESSVNLVLESIYRQLFTNCLQKEDILESYRCTLPEDEAAVFESQMPETGIPAKNHIWNLIKRLLKHAAASVLVCLDRMHEIHDLPRTTIISLLDSLKSDQVSLKAKILFCGDANSINQDNVLGTPIVSGETEVQECLASLSFQEINVRKSQVPPAAEGTASWIWSHPVYLEFATASSGILWIRGKPGSGKSVLARSIQRRLLEASSPRNAAVNQRLVGDWFYHRRRGGGYVRHESFLRSVLYHFLDQRPLLFDEFFQDEHRKKDPRNLSPWTNDVLVNILKMVCQSDARIICVIDAVDEAESAEIISLIHSLITPDGRSNARFIILSRPNVQIECRIEDAPTIVVEHENANDINRIVDLGLSSLQKALHSLDIRKPISNRQSGRPLMRGSTRQPRYRTFASPAEREKRAISEIREVLVSKAQGSILWVKLVLDKLVYEAESNEGSTLEELRQIVNRVPEELSDYYRQIAEDLTSHKSPERIHEIRQALMWICSAPEIGDVTLDGVWEALALLKDDMRSRKLDEIWWKQIFVNCYDELWRKISSICGPFIEIFNPGLSAEESRMYHYGPSSVVQLMHQSVRDFLCDHERGHTLCFTIEEARQVVRDRLAHYLGLTLSDYTIMKQEEYQDPQPVVNWLNDQKLLRLAIAADKSPLHTKLQFLRQTSQWKFSSDSQETPEESLVRTVHEYICRARGTQGMDQNSVLTIGRIFFRCCTEGLCTAVCNILALGWVEPEAAISTLGDVIICSAILAASRSGSRKVTVKLDLYGNNATPAIFPWDLSQRVKQMPQSTTPPIPSLLRYCISIEDLLADLDIDTRSTQVDELSVPYKYSQKSSETLISDHFVNRNPSEMEQRNFESMRIYETVLTQSLPIASNPNAEEQQEHTDSDNHMTKYASSWVTRPWTVILEYNNKGLRQEQRITFESWMPFLDVVCGSKRLQVKQRDTLEDELEVTDDVIIAQLEDVEDTIITAMGIYS